ncbi:MAG: hypothetical protein U1F77_08505 [Kiritimatiellia bacterium]
MHRHLLPALILSVLSADVRARRAPSPGGSGAAGVVACPAEEKEHVPSPEELAALASAREAGDRIRATRPVCSPPMT